MQPIPVAAGVAAHISPRAPIIKGEYVFLRVREEDRAMRAAHNEPSLGLQLLESACP
jgi:hypothetical protein